ncbi:MAG: phosphate acetyltransferase [Epsilonproteobacteria bacterium]|nr:MAG: phosphate acetyltransferase [Campylobacterota bacterium]
MTAKSLYIASLEPMAGSLFITVGFMELLTRRFSRVAFFRPVIESLEKKDEDIVFILEHFSLQMVYEDAYGFSVDEIETMAADNGEHEGMNALIRKFAFLQSRYDFVLCEGLDRTRFSATFDFDINLRLAKNFSAPFISVIKGKNRKPKALFEEIRLEERAIKREGTVHFATFVNRLKIATLKSLTKKIKARSKSKIPVYFLPEEAELDKPSVAEVMRELGCKHLFGSEEDLERVVSQSKVAAMTLDNYLIHIEEGDLIIVPGDRTDIIVGTLMAVYSRHYPHIAGMLLSGGLVPDSDMMKLMAGLNQFPLPILSMQSDTYSAAMQVNDVPSKIRPHSKRKIALAKGLFSAHTDVSRIEAGLESAQSDIVTPSMFEFMLFERARKERKRIVLPESSDDRILQATEILLRREVADIVLIGNPEELNHRSTMLGLDISRAEIIDPEHSKQSEKYIRKFYELRQGKGLQMDAAKDAMTHINYFATMMVQMGDADGMVSGAIHTTGDTIRPALQIIKTAPGVSLVSSLFFMCMDTRVLVYADCAINLDPDAEQLAEIAISSAGTAMKFGIEPKIAMLSYSTGNSGKGKDVDKVRRATQIVRERRPDLLVEGPIQYDAAIDPVVAAKKLPQSEVAGQATLFIFPNLNTGNNTYKAVQRSSGAIAIGPILQGLNKPVNDLSRGALVDDIVNTVAITAIQAQSEVET